MSYKCSWHVWNFLFDHSRLTDSYNFVYGGTVNASADRLTSSAADYEDVLVLSLTAFKWFRTPGAGERRSNHHCQIVGNRQMLVIGSHNPVEEEAGRELGQTGETSGVADPWVHGLGIFDMTVLSWSSGYNAKAGPYEQ